MRHAALAAVLLSLHGVCVQAQPADRNLRVSATSGSGVAVSAQRVALVIGNGSYKESPLTNPVNDARAIAQALRESGFSVISRENLDQRAMQAVLREFGDRLRLGGVGLFYYAGHGMQIKGRNYLIPVGAAIEREDEVAYSAVDAQAVLDKMEAAANGTNIMILDACRNNPFTRSFRSGAAGLAQMDAPVGTLVAFATSPGSVASDGNGQNGLYTQHLLTAMRQPGAKVEDVFKQVRAAVRRDSQGKQVPWESTSLEGDFFFSQPATPVQPQQALDEAMWEMVRQSSEPLEIRAYLNRFPQGQFAVQAQNRLQQLKATGSPQAGAGVPVAVLTPAVQAPKPPPKMAASAVAPAEAAAVSQGANPFGFSRGDRWRYQVVDKYKGEVVRNYAYKVDNILPTGEMWWNGSNIKTSARGGFLRDVNSSWPVREWTEELPLVPRELKVGAKQDIKYQMRARRASDTVEFQEDYSGTLVVKGRERVRVPAGEFEALVVEREVTYTGHRLDGSPYWFGRWSTVGWYVPEIRAYVARDDSFGLSGRPPTRERTELTSYEVAKAGPVVATR